MSATTLLKQAVELAIYNQNRRKNKKYRELWKKRKRRKSIERPAIDAKRLRESFRAKFRKGAADD